MHRLNKLNKLILILVNHIRRLKSSLTMSKKSKIIMECLIIKVMRTQKILEWFNKMRFFTNWAKGERMIIEDIHVVQSKSIMESPRYISESTMNIKVQSFSTQIREYPLLFIHGKILWTTSIKSTEISRKLKSSRWLCLSHRKGLLQSVRHKNLRELLRSKNKLIHKNRGRAIIKEKTTIKRRSHQVNSDF